MKRLLIKWGVIALLTLVIACVIGGMAVKIRNQAEMLENANQNLVAHLAESDSLTNQCKMFKMDIATLTSLNDSIMNKMYAQAKQLKIKDKQIQGLQYRKEIIEKRDTIFVRDTIFKQPDFVLDTCLVDHWSKMCLHLEAPNTVGVSASFNNEMYTTIYERKVPIKPRKCKIAEWFTRKRKEIVVEVHTDNPYVETKFQRFVQIVK
jgi:hypothetical protein